MFVDIDLLDRDHTWQPRMARGNLASVSSSKVNPNERFVSPKQHKPERDQHIQEGYETAV